MPTREAPDYLSLLRRLDRKYREMSENEVRFEAGEIDDADLVIVAYGYCARVARRATELCRAQGLRVGWFRPITVWPFPHQQIKELAHKGKQFLVVEDSLGQMVDDVKMAVEGKAPVHFLGALARHLPTEMGLIFPERVVEEIRRLL